MEKMPREAQKRIAVLDNYKLNENLKTCHIVHMYDEGIYGATDDGSMGNGFYDSKLFTAWCFNTDKMEKVKFEGRDELDFGRGLRTESPVMMVRIFADGSTLVKFNREMKIGWGQSLCFNELN